MRPRGSYGDVAQALLRAADAGPGAVRTLAERAQVGYDAARYTASRLVTVGELVVLEPEARPATLARPTDPAAAGVCVGVDQALDDLERSFWERGPERCT